MIIFSYVFLGLGAIFLVAGLVKQMTQKDTPAAGEHGAEDVINASTGFLQELGKFGSGMQLIIVGILLLVAGVVCWMLGTTGSILG